MKVVSDGHDLTNFDPKLILGHFIERSDLLSGAKLLDFSESFAVRNVSTLMNSGE